MAKERFNLASIKDQGIRKALQKALANNRLEGKEVRRIIDAALADRSGKLRLDQQEVNDLLLIVDQSVTMRMADRNRIRKTIFVEYTRHSIRDHSLGKALNALAKKVPNLEDLKKVAKAALDKEKDANGNMVTLTKNEINDLLLLKNSFSKAEFRRFILRFVMENVKPLPPPATIPTPSCMTIETKDAGGNYSVPVVIKQDATATISLENLDSPLAPDTELVNSMPYPASGTADTGLVISRTAPQYNYDLKTKKITEVLQWPRIQKCIIQIRYGSGTNSRTLSGYGRGTTDDDLRTGNVTLGHHENCHREVFKDFLRQHKFPIFQGKVGHTRAQFENKAELWTKALKRYNAEADKLGKRLVDEVGYTKTESRQKKL